MITLKLNNSAVALKQLQQAEKAARAEPLKEATGSASKRKKFRRLTFDMMVAWEFPEADSEPFLHVDDDVTVGIEAFSRIAPAVPVVADVVVELMKRETHNEIERKKLSEDLEQPDVLRAKVFLDSLVSADHKVKIQVDSQDACNNIVSVVYNHVVTVTKDTLITLFRLPGDGLKVHEQALPSKIELWNGWKLSHVHHRDFSYNLKESLSPEIVQFMDIVLAEIHQATGTFKAKVGFLNHLRHIIQEQIEEKIPGVQVEHSSPDKNYFRQSFSVGRTVEIPSSQGRLEDHSKKLTAQIKGKSFYLKLTLQLKSCSRLLKVDDRTMLHLARARDDSFWITKGEWSRNWMNYPLSMPPTISEIMDYMIKRFKCSGRSILSLSDLAYLMPTEEVYAWLSSSMPDLLDPHATDNLLATSFSFMPQLPVPSHEPHQFTLLDDAKKGEEKNDDGRAWEWKNNDAGNLTLWDQIQREAQLQGEVQLEQQAQQTWTWRNAQQTWGIHSIPAYFVVFCVPRGTLGVKFELLTRAGGITSNSTTGIRVLLPPIGKPVYAPPPPRIRPHVVPLTTPVQFTSLVQPAIVTQSTSPPVQLVINMPSQDTVVVIAEVAESVTDFKEARLDLSVSSKSNLEVLTQEESNLELLVLKEDDLKLLMQSNPVHNEFAVDEMQQLEANRGGIEVVPSASCVDESDIQEKSNMGTLLISPFYYQLVHCSTLFQVVKEEPPEMQIIRRMVEIDALKMQFADLEVKFLRDQILQHSHKFLSKLYMRVFDPGGLNSRSNSFEKGGNDEPEISMESDVKMCREPD
ncbi:heat-inducible transcription repressor [Perilla frutescens var. frutescens]|nr:heat-inducible transcription repressor [Perilla frutescens var. frutescens]